MSCLMHLDKVAEPNALHQDLMIFIYIKNKLKKSITSKPVHTSMQMV